MSQDNFLALDIGSKRIGVAIGSVMPFGRGVLDAQNQAAALEQLHQLISENHITAIVVGIPRVKSGDITQSQQLALEWIQLLKDTFAVPVETVDESYSSLEAEDQLKSEKVDITTEKWRIDERAAELILAQYISEHQTSHEKV